MQARSLLPGLICVALCASCDSSTPAPESSCVDADGDGYGGCDAGGDCDDADASVHPGAPDLDCAGSADLDCDGVQDDCIVWTQVSSGAYHTCALDDAGIPYCWGDDRFGQLGIGQIGLAATTPTPVDLSALPAGTTFVRISAGDQHTCAVDDAGLAYCWGSDVSGQLGQGVSGVVEPSPVAIDPAAFGGDSVVDIAAGYTSTCAATSAGRVFCWGVGGHGELGVDTVQALDPVEAALPTTASFVRVANANSQACALTRTGDLYCWGRGWGPLAADTSVPWLHQGGPWARVALGFGYDCVLSAAGDASCEGFGKLGQLGAGPDVTDAELTPVVTSGIPDFTGFAALTAGDSVTCGITLEGAAYCWGRDDLGAVGDGEGDVAAYVPVAVTASGLMAGERWTELSAGNSHVCGITSAGALRCWGSDGADQLGDDGEPSSTSTPRPVDTSALESGETVVRVSTGAHHGCELTSHGRVLCWGHGAYGRLETGELATDSRRPLPIALDSIGTSTRFVDVSAGFDHSCAVATDGAAYCWGSDSAGQLGDNEPLLGNASPVPVDRSAVTGDGKLVRVFAGFDGTCAIATDGSAYCWGAASDLSGATSTPRRIDTSALGGDTRVVQIDVGWIACATTVDGRGICWGENYRGALANGTTPSGSTAVEIDLSLVTGSQVVVRMVTAQFHSCALMADGAAYCAGSYEEALGLGYVPASDVFSPTPVAMSGVGPAGFSYLATGTNATCALDGDGAPWCWGSDHFGLIDGSSAESTFDAPVPIALGSLAPGSFSEVSLGDWTACALSTDGRAFCWGANTYGELGDGGDLPWSPEPVLVRAVRS